MGPTNTRGADAIKQIKSASFQVQFKHLKTGFLAYFSYSFHISGIIEVSSHDDLRYVRHVTARLKGPKNSDGTASSQPSQPLCGFQLT